MSFQPSSLHGRRPSSATVRSVATKRVYWVSSFGLLRWAPVAAEELGYDVGRGAARRRRARRTPWRSDWRIGFTFAGPWELLSRDQARTAGKATMAELPVNPWLVPVADGE